MPELSGNSNTTVTLRPVSQRVPVVFAFVAIGALRGQLCGPAAVEQTPSRW